MRSVAGQRSRGQRYYVNLKNNGVKPKPSPAQANFFREQIKRLDPEVRTRLKDIYAHTGFTSGFQNLLRDTLKTAGQSTRVKVSDSFASNALFNYSGSRGSHGNVNAGKKDQGGNSIDTQVTDKPVGSLSRGDGTNTYGDKPQITQSKAGTFSTLDFTPSSNPRGQHYTASRAIDPQYPMQGAGWIHNSGHTNARAPGNRSRTGIYLDKASRGIPGSPSLDYLSAPDQVLEYRRRHLGASLPESQQRYYRWRQQLQSPLSRAQYRPEVASNRRTGQYALLRQRELFEQQMQQQFQQQQLQQQRFQLGEPNRFLPPPPPMFKQQQQLQQHQLPNSGNHIASSHLAPQSTENAPEKHGQTPAKTKPEAAASRQSNSEALNSDNKNTTSIQQSDVTSGVSQTGHQSQPVDKFKLNKNTHTYQPEKVGHTQLNSNVANTTPEKSIQSVPNIYQSMNTRDASSLQNTWQIIPPSLTSRGSIQTSTLASPTTTLTTIRPINIPTMNLLKPLTSLRQPQPTSTNAPSVNTTVFISGHRSSSEVLIVTLPKVTQKPKVTTEETKSTLLLGQGHQQHSLPATEQNTSINTKTNSWIPAATSSTTSTTRSPSFRTASSEASVLSSTTPAILTTTKKAVPFYKSDVQLTPALFLTWSLPSSQVKGLMGSELQTVLTSINASRSQPGLTYNSKVEQFRSFLIHTLLEDPRSYTITSDDIHGQKFHERTDEGPSIVVKVLLPGFLNDTGIQAKTRRKRSEGVGSFNVSSENHHTVAATSTATDNSIDTQERISSPKITRLPAHNIARVHGNSKLFEFNFNAGDDFKLSNFFNFNRRIQASISVDTTPNVNIGHEGRRKKRKAKFPNDPLKPVLKFIWLLPEGSFPPKPGETVDFIMRRFKQKPQLSISGYKIGNSTTHIYKSENKVGNSTTYNNKSENKVGNSTKYNDKSENMFGNSATYSDNSNRSHNSTVSLASIIVPQNASSHRETGTNAGYEGIATPNVGAMIRMVESLAQFLRLRGEFMKSLDTNALDHERQNWTAVNLNVLRTLLENQGIQRGLNNKFNMRIPDGQAKRTNVSDNNGRLPFIDAMFSALQGHGNAVPSVDWLVSSLSANINQSQDLSSPLPWIRLKTQPTGSGEANHVMHSAMFEVMHPHIMRTTPRTSGNASVNMEMYKNESHVLKIDGLAASVSSLNISPPYLPSRNKSPLTLLNTLSLSVTPLNTPSSSLFLFNTPSASLPAFNTSSPYFPAFNSPSPSLPPFITLSSLPLFNTPSPPLPPFNTPSAYLPPFNTPSPSLPPFNTPSLPPVNIPSPSLPPLNASSPFLAPFITPSSLPPFNTPSPSLPPFNTPSSSLLQFNTPSLPLPPFSISPLPLNLFNTPPPSWPPFSTSPPLLHPLNTPPLSLPPPNTSPPSLSPTNTPPPSTISLKSLPLPNTSPPYLSLTNTSFPSLSPLNKQPPSLTPFSASLPSLTPLNTSPSPSVKISPPSLPSPNTQPSTTLLYPPSVFPLTNSVTRKQNPEIMKPSPFPSLTPNYQDKHTLDPDPKAGQYQGHLVKSSPTFLPHASLVTHGQTSIPSLTTQSVETVLLSKSETTKSILSFDEEKTFHITTPAIQDNSLAESRVLNNQTGIHQDVDKSKLDRSYFYGFMELLWNAVEMMADRKFGHNAAITTTTLTPQTTTSGLCPPGLAMTCAPAKVSARLFSFCQQRCDVSTGVCSTALCECLCGVEYVAGEQASQPRGGTGWGSWTSVGNDPNLMESGNVLISGFDPELTPAFSPRPVTTTKVTLRDISTISDEHFQKFLEFLAQRNKDLQSHKNGNKESEMEW